MDVKTFLKTFLKAYYDVFEGKEKYVSSDTKLLKGCIYVARDLVREGYLSELPISYGWHHYGVYGCGAHNLLMTFNILFQHSGNIKNVDEKLYRIIKRILSNKYYEIFLDSKKFREYNHKGILKDVKKENRELGELLEKYYDLVDNKINKSFDDIISGQSLLFSSKSNTENLKKYMVELMELLPFEYRGDEREEAFWDYMDLLFLFLKGYERHKNIEPIKELKELFKIQVCTIISPFPETLTGNPEMCKRDLEEYDRRLNKALKELNNRLEELREKYKEYLPTFEELRAEVKIVPLNDKLRKELKAELGLKSE